MKTFLYTVLFFSFSVIASAQDVIVQKNSTTIISKVLEITDSEVKYKKFSNLDGPTYTKKISELQCINFQNGEKETFEDTSNAFNISSEDANVVGASDEELLKMAGSSFVYHPAFVVLPEDYINKKGKRMSSINRKQLKIYIDYITGSGKGYFLNKSFAKKKTVKDSYKWLKTHWGCYDKYIDTKYIPQ